MRSRKIAWIALCCVMGSFFASAQAAQTSSDLYLLQIPGLGEDTVEHPNRERHLVRLVGDGQQRRLRRVFPDLYFSEFTGWDDLWEGKLSPGLAVTGPEEDDGAVTIEGVIVGIPMYYGVALEGRRERPGYWEGKARIKLFPYGHEWVGHMESRWCLQSAPPSRVFTHMVAALEHLRRLSEGPQVYYDGPRLDTAEDYVVYLREGNWPLPKGTILWKPIEPRFRNAIADALAQGWIVLTDEGFDVAREVRRAFEDEAPPRVIDMKVTAHGIPRLERKEPPQEEQRLEKLLRNYRPPRTADSLRRLAHWPDREQRLAVAGERVERFISAMDYTWDELQFIPGVAFLAEHIASVPPELQNRAAERYIRDGSEDFFPGMDWAELARVPNPILLMACLPRIRDTAQREQKALAGILHKEGYTLDELEQMAGSERMRMKEKYPEFGRLAVRRTPVGRAEALAATERVKPLLDVSGLRIEEIGKYTIPQLVAKVLSPMSSKEAQALVDETPKFNEYLRDSEDGELKALVKQKGLKLGPAPTD